MSAHIRSSGTRPDPSSTVPPERDPLTGRPVELDHDDKQRHRDDGARRPDPAGRAPGGGRPSRGRRATPRPRWLVPVGAAGATVVIVVGVVLATSRSSAPVLDAQPVPASAPVGASSGTDGSALGTGSPTPSGTGTATGAGIALVPPSDSVTGSATRPVSSRPTSSSAPITRASSTPPTTSRSTPTRSTAAGPPAALTASRIWGYRISSPAARVVNPDLAGITGDTGYTGVLRCPGGRCPAVTGLGGIPTFTAATGRIASQQSTGVNSDSRCQPTVFTVDLARSGDGSYRGTSSVIPRATEASWNDGIQRSCRTFSVERTITLDPLVLQVPAPAGTPAALDPARITGYRYPDADDTGAEYLPTCSDGWCTLTCPVGGCSATLAFPAAPTRFTIPPVPLTTPRCGTGRVGFVVDRDAKGAVEFTITPALSVTTPECRQPRYLQATPVTR